MLNDKLFESQQFQHSTAEQSLLAALEHGASAKDLGKQIDQLWREAIATLYQDVCRRLRPRPASGDRHDDIDLAGNVILDLRARAFALLHAQMTGASTLEEEQKPLLEYHQNQQRSFYDYLWGLAGSRRGGSIANVVQAERRCQDHMQTNAERLLSSGSAVAVIHDAQRFSLCHSRPDLALECKQAVAALHAAILSLDSATDRLVIALRHDVLGAAAVIDRVVLADASPDEFVGWAIEKLQLDKKIAKKIARRLCRHRPAIRARLESPAVRPIELLSNEEIADLLDVSDTKVSRLATAALKALQERLAA